MQAANFLNIFANGPVDCSALAASENYASNTDGPIIGANNAIDWDATANHILANYAAPSSLYLAGACVYLANVPDMVEAAPVASGTWVAAGVANRPPTPAVAADVKAEHVLHGGALLIAGKVNYWKLNHHVGTPNTAGYVLKVCEKLGIAHADPVIGPLIWRVLHWADTKVTLAALGINIPGNPAFDARVRAVSALVRMPDDAIKRIRSNPAGTAGWCDIWTGIKTAETIDAARLCGPSLAGSKEDYEAMADAIQANGAAYHMGARYLVGAPKIDCPEWPAPVKNWVYTTLRFYDENSTLLRAAVFNHCSEVASHIDAFRAYSKIATDGMAAAYRGLTYA